MKENELHWREVEYEITDDEVQTAERITEVDEGLWIKLEKVGKKIYFCRDIKAWYY